MSNERTGVECACLMDGREWGGVKVDEKVKWTRGRSVSGCLMNALGRKRHAG